MFLLKGNELVDSWYKESTVYKYTNPDFSNTHQFAKVIWNGASQLGVGRAYSKDSITQYIVAVYNPGGYVEESYTDNVKQRC